MKLELLDNPIWHALETFQKDLAIQNAFAKILPSDVGLFSAIESVTPESLEGLAQLIHANNATVALFSPQTIQLPESLKRITTLEITQMICQNLKPAAALELCELTLNDVPEMLELVELTKPGPFAKRTIEMGRFWGIRVDQKLVAMTGERFHLHGFCEVSGVCTHPDFRARGFAKSLITQVSQHILARGETPFLHVMAENDNAIRVYQQLGFVERQQFNGYVLRAKSMEVSA